MGRKTEASKNWKAYWESSREVSDWDYTSQIVFSVLRREVNSLIGSNIAEIGCGTGRISLKMALEKADVSVIDISEKAIENTLKIFQQANQPLRYAVGSIFAIPVHENTLDVVWNAGVIEHFSENEIKEAIAEMAKSCKPGGYVIILAPHKWAIFYRIGKFISELLGKWPFGYEAPIKTLNGFNNAGELHLLKEYSIGSFLVFVEAFRVFKFTYFITIALRKLFISLHQGILGNIFWRIDRLFSSLLGGYLLVSVFQRPKTPQKY